MKRSTIFMLAGLSGTGLACTATDKGGTDWVGEERDARLISDVYTWLCDDGTEYQGVFKQQISLAFAPDGLGSLSPPSAGGCQLNKDMFPSSAGAMGTDLPDFSSEPRWASAVDSGELSELGAGFWKDDVTENVHSCKDITGSVELTDASVLTGVTTPAPPEVPVVDFDGLTYHPETGAETIEWGDPVVASWDEHEWEEVWVQIRREREGEAWESVTCNATGDSSFTMEQDFWDLMDEDLSVEQNNIYVAFTMSNEEESEDGIKVEAVTRAMAVAIVQD